MIIIQRCQKYVNYQIKQNDFSSSNDKISRPRKNNGVSTEDLIVLLVNFVIHAITFLLHETKTELLFFSNDYT